MMYEEISHNGQLGVFWRHLSPLTSKRRSKSLQRRRRSQLCDFILNLLCHQLAFKICKEQKNISSCLPISGCFHSILSTRQHQHFQLCSPANNYYGRRTTESTEQKKETFFLQCSCFPVNIDPAGGTERYESAFLCSFC